VSSPGTRPRQAASGRGRSEPKRADDPPSSGLLLLRSSPSGPLQRRFVSRRLSSPCESSAAISLIQGSPGSASATSAISRSRSLPLAYQRPSRLERSETTQRSARAESAASDRQESASPQLVAGRPARAGCRPSQAAGPTSRARSSSSASWSCPWLPSVASAPLPPSDPPRVRALWNRTRCYPATAEPLPTFRADCCGKYGSLFTSARTRRLRFSASRAAVDRSWSGRFRSTKPKTPRSSVVSGLQSRVVESKQAADRPR
jgi:hypothetical protein